MKLLPFFSICLIWSLSQSACGPQNKLHDDNQCTQTGVVKDFTGLDGCGIMIIAEDGKKLLPVSFPEEETELKDGQHIRFDYRETEAMSICMAEDKIVEITCLEIDTPTTGCQDIDQPMEVEWMKKAITNDPPEQILRFPAGNQQWLYLFKGNKVRLFDCSGNVICQTESASSAECMMKLPQDVAGQVIWQREYKND